MNIKQLDAFVRIAGNGSFSKTAKEMYITQPTVSAYISSLEEELGVRLLARTTKAVSMTEAGQKVYLYAKDIVELSEKIKKTFQADEGGDVSHIVISTSTIPGQFLLPGILAEFSRLYPHTRYRINETDSRGVVDDLAKHEADIGFAGTMIPADGCEYYPFYDDELIIAAPNTEKYRGYAENPDDLSWIADQDFIIRESGSGTRREAVRVLASMGIMQDSLHAVASFASTGAILMSVKEGMGIAVVSLLAAKPYIENGDILSFSFNSKKSFRKIYAVTSSSYSVSEGGRRMLHLVKKMYKQH